MLFDSAFQRKFALSDKGVAMVKKGTLWTVVVNLVVMGGVDILYLVMGQLMDTLAAGLPPLGVLVLTLCTIVFLVVSFAVHSQQYRATYGLVYDEVKNVRIGLAEQLRKLPLSFFSRRDLADLTETIMGDVNRMEHVWSHVLGYLYGAIISTVIIAVVLLVMDWRLAIACLWGVPVAFALLFAGRRLIERNSARTRAAALEVSDGIQEALENVREIRSTNQEQRVLAALDDKIDAHERAMVKGELAAGLFMNGASVVMRLGVATTLLTGAYLIVFGQVGFMMLFLFLLVVTRIYAPFDQALALIGEVFYSEVSARRLMEIYDTPTATGTSTFDPQGHDIAFKDVGFSYDDEQVLHDVSFTAREGEVTALVGPSGSGKSTCARLAARLLETSEGTITVGGVDISTADPEVLLGDYSMVFQDVTLFDDTVIENTAWEGMVPRMRRRLRLQLQPTATSLCRTCPRDTARLSAKMGRGCRAGSASASPSPAPC